MLKRLAIVVGLTGFTFAASGQDLHVFRNGEVADADKINENFQEIKSTISGLTAIGRPSIAINTAALVTSSSHDLTVTFSGETPAMTSTVTDYCVTSENPFEVPLQTEIYSRSYSYDATYSPD